MSKIICDVCGTSYPDTANQCPICGCARAEISETIPQSGATETAAGGTYTYVKGGRFSKANVRKRNLARQMPAEEPQLEVTEEEEKESGGKGLIVAAIILLIAIIAVVIYIAVRFFGPAPQDRPETTQTTQSTTAGTEVLTEATELLVPCVELELSSYAIRFNAVGDAQLLDAIPDPVDTTDSVVFTSSDESVVSVTVDGKVVAVGPGQATIDVICGNAKATCDVTCDIETESTEETTEPTTAPQQNFELNRSDFSLFAAGETWNLYTGDISQDEIIWTTADEKVAVVEKGIVKAVGPGDTTITAEYQGIKYNCTVRCRFTVEETEPTAPTNGSETSNDSQSYVLCVNGVIKEGYDADVTIIVGESFTLTLENENGETVPVAWSYDANVCSVSGNIVTGAGKSSGSKVSTFYNGVAYECIVRVR